MSDMSNLWDKLNGFEHALKSMKAEMVSVLNLTFYFLFSFRFLLVLSEERLILDNFVVGVSFSCFGQPPVVFTVGSSVAMTTSRHA